MEPIIETHNLTKYYPSVKTYKEILVSPFKRRYVQALKNVSMSIERGSIFGILGPNGAGKTTLIKILSTLVLPSSGTALVNGFDVVRHGREVRQSIGLVMTEERSFYWRLTGRQNLRFFATLNNLSGHEGDQRVSEVLCQTELESDGDRMFKDYSTGMKQRLAIARGLLCNPDIILLDEPTRSLDPHSARHLRTFIKEKIVGENRRTALLATHNMLEAEGLCTNIAIIKGGTIMAQGTMDAIRKKNSAYYYMVRLSPESSFTDIGSLPGAGNVKVTGDIPNMFQIKTTDISTVIHAILDRGGRVEECVQKRLSLEEVFSEIIEEGV